MSDKYLPIGTYVVTVQAVGGEFTDGGVLSLMFPHPLPPEMVQLAAAEALETLAPKRLEEMPAGAWWHVAVAYFAGVEVFPRCMLAGQEQLRHPLQSDHYLSDLADLVPRLTGAIALAMAEHIGVAPFQSQSDTAERPALLN